MLTKPRPKTLAAGRGPDLPAFGEDFFAFVLQLRTLPDLGHPDNLRKKLMQRFETLEGRARAAQIDSRDFQEAKFALTAFVDEIILNSNWRYKEVWRSRPLQLAYFSTNLAGQEFFEHLERLREDRDHRAAVLEVYYLCLALGFEGKFKLHGKRELQRLKNALAAELRETRAVAETALSFFEPAAFRPARSNEPMSWLVVVLCLLVGFLSLVVMSTWIASKVNQLNY